ncbi:MAG: metal-sulfur cluster assembly factor [Promethearchaeota archaeon]
MELVIELVAEEDVIGALRNCYDPEIPVNIVDLGLVYDVKIEGKKVSVKMTLTARGCPMHSFIADNAKQKIMELDGVDDVDVEVVWDPPWTPERMSDETKRLLGFKK